MLLALAFALLFLYCVFMKYGVIRDQIGGTSSGSGSDPDPGSTITTLNHIVHREKLMKETDSDICRTAKCLTKINNKLNHGCKLSDKDHHTLQKIAKIEPSVHGRINFIDTINKKNFDCKNKNVLDRLKRLEKYVCQLKREANKNQNVLSDVNQKLQSSVTTEEETAGPAPVDNDEEQKRKITETSNVIKQNCPVCPMYAQTHPVNILEVTGQGFGTIAPTSHTLTS